MIDRDLAPTTDPHGQSTRKRVFGNASFSTQRNRRCGRRFALEWLPAQDAARRIYIMTQPAIPYAAILSLPHGALGVNCSESVLAALDYLPAQPTVAPRESLAIEAVAQLRAWLQDPTFRFDLPLARAGSVFQQRVWQTISTIPCGKTLTYGELSRRVGSAPRAVGQACGANPFPILVPCHRVVASRGGLGGFAHASQGYLLDIKRWLLERESRNRAA